LPRCFYTGSAAKILRELTNIEREIDSQYVITYTPKRAAGEAAVEEDRRVNVRRGVIGLHVPAGAGRWLERNERSIRRRCDNIFAEGQNVFSKIGLIVEQTQWVSESTSRRR
jgi:hypothetical protein